MALLKQGETAIAWGYLSKDASFRKFDSGKQVANFSICYGSEPGEDGGRRKYKYIGVDAWGLLGLYASAFEKGDTVLVAGRLEKDEYRSQKKGFDIYKIIADVAIVQPVFAEEDHSLDPPVFTELDGDGGGDAELPF